MSSSKKTHRKPSIQIAQSDHARLAALANAVAERSPEISDQLFTEIERARIVSDRAISPSVVRMGSTVTYKSDINDVKTVTLVFPGEADISQGKVSILTPIGTALLGLSEGQSMDWTTRDTRLHQLTVLSVKAPAPVEAE